MHPNVHKVVKGLADLGIEAEVREFSTAVPTALAAAEQLGCDVGAIANSLVFNADGEALLILASGSHRVDLKLVANAIGVKKIRRADPDFVLKSTGQTVGGVAPLGHPKPLRTLVDLELKSHDVVWAGAGTEEAMFRTTADQLVEITAGEFVQVV